MAISQSFFGLRRGSTKSHTYSIFNGKQVTKDRVSEVKNPRTASQMRQRMLLTTIGALYKTMQPICDHSFESKSYGLQSMNYFMSRNLKEIQANALANPQTWNFNAFGNAKARPNPILVSEGTVTPYPGTLTGLGAVAVSFDLVGPSTTLSVGAIKAYLGLQDNDFVTFVGIAVDKAAVADFNGVSQPNNGSLVVARLHIPSDQDDTVITAENVVEVFEPEFLNASLGAVASGDSGVTIETTAGVIDAAAVIISRKGGNGWLRSTETLQLSDSAISGSLSAVLASYPVSNEYILNGGDF